MIWLGIIILVLTIGYIVMRIAFDNLEHRNDYPFEVKMAAVKAAEDEARRWR
jgi:uncharacterized membrane protein YwaF